MRHIAQELLLSPMGWFNAIYPVEWGYIHHSPETVETSKHLLLTVFVLFIVYFDCNCIDFFNIFARKITRSKQTAFCVTLTLAMHLCHCYIALMPLLYSDNLGIFMVMFFSVFFNSPEGA